LAISIICSEVVVGFPASRLVVGTVFAAGAAKRNFLQLHVLLSSDTMRMRQDMAQNFARRGWTVAPRSVAVAPLWLIV
jgi:hypothetical protein